MSNWRDSKPVNRTAKVLLQCLVFLGLMAAATTGANADGRAIEKLYHGDGLHYLDNKPCKKLGLPDPLEHQCNRATSQAPVSSRPRTNDKSDPADVLVAPTRPTLRESVSVEVAQLTTELRRSSRRSSFWQVYAYSARLRN